MRFGDELIFGLRCAVPAEDNDYLGVAVVVGGQEFGNVGRMCPAGVVMHSAKVFLKYTGQREFDRPDCRHTFHDLVATSYGDGWRIGVANQYRARFGLHEVFDVSVAESGWLIFLVDSPTGSSLLVGTRDVGLLRIQEVRTRYVEEVLVDLMNWAQRH